MLNQTVGVLLNQSVFKGISSGKTHHECLDFYVSSGEKYKLTPCFFRLSDLSLQQRKVHAYVPVPNGYKRQWMDLPKIIHNRAIYFSRSAKSKLEQLTAAEYTVFNGWNRYGKLKIHRLLMENPAIRHHFPETMEVTKQGIQEMLEKYREIILKPDMSSVGRGIMKIERLADGFIWTFRHPKTKQWKKVFFREQPPRLLHSILQKERYLIQQRLPLASFMGRPFDLRVSVQRDNSGEWKITGIVGKVARPGHFLTNAAQGGSMYPLSVILKQFPHLSPGQVLEDIHRFALQVAADLQIHLPGLADIGLDICLTEEGLPMFIECNSRDLRYTFHKAGLHDEWRSTYENPIGYARFLYDRVVR